MDRKQEMLDQIQKIKHNFSLLVPTTIELMFDACVGVLYEEYNDKMAGYHASEKRAGQSIKLDLLRARTERQFSEGKTLVLHLKERVTNIYTEVMNEPKEDQTETRARGTRRRGPSSPPTES